MNHRLYRFREFTLDPAARELRQGSEPVELPTSAFDCLVYLLERRERAVGRDELMAAIWGRADVADGLLGQTLVRVRRTLGDTGNEQHTIRTVPRFGYRWVAPVDEETVAAIEPPPVPLATPEPEIPAIEATPTPAVAAPAPRRRSPWLAAFAAALVAVALLVAWQLRRPGTATATHAATAPALTTAALVLPAVVEAG
ncbi:MAG TPA: transcriptional regulator, partial [Tahibacter sp.]|nr:transcriptional regulator [Tahibacter sp.]